MKVKWEGLAKKMVIVKLLSNLMKYLLSKNLKYRYKIWATLIVLKRYNKIQKVKWSRKMYDQKQMLIKEFNPFLYGKGNDIL
jgi:hypothetical protein